MQQGLLPLFPLQAVLFPGGLLPLHIFEERYKEMMGEVIGEKLEFGVVLAHEKGIVNTGCTATVDRVLRQYPDGRMDILTTGRRRFEILLLNEERTFLRGAVEFFDDEDPPRAIPADLQQRVIEGYNQIRAIESEESLNAADATDPRLSFRLAGAIPDLAFRQTLLALRSEGDRIRQMAEFFPGYILRQKRIQHAKQVAPGNGHGRPGGPP
jgi:Lon protease-like protein